MNCGNILDQAVRDPIEKKCQEIEKLREVVKDAQETRAHVREEARELGGSKPAQEQLQRETEILSSLRRAQEGLDQSRQDLEEVKKRFDKTHAPEKSETIADDFYLDETFKKQSICVGGALEGLLRIVRRKSLFAQVVIPRPSLRCAESTHIF